MKDRKEAILAFTAIEQIEAYMSGPSADAKGFWLKLAKAGASERTISKEEAIEAALCCGWIDGQLDRFDEHYYLVRMTPRRPGSRWSAKNCATAARPAKAGRVNAAGLPQAQAAPGAGRRPVASARRGSPRSGRPRATEDGTPPIHHRGRPRCPTIWRPRWRA